jgi:hypothetical protein
VHRIQVAEVLPLQPVALLLAQLGRVRTAIEKDKRVFVELIRWVSLRQVDIRQGY